MNDNLILLLSDIFFKMQSEGKDEYLMLKFSVPCNALYKLYNKLVQVDVPPIESINNDEKSKYWDIAKRYYTDKESAIKGSKAAYILSLITSQ